MKLATLLFALLAAAQLCAEPKPRALTIGPGDLLSVEVFDVPELKQEIRVSDSGDADFALLGRIHLAELTAAEAAQSIAAQLKTKELVVNPQVSVLIREYATQGVAVSGEVRKAGVYQVLGPRTLLQVLSEAGGFTELASPNITITHRDGEHEAVLRSDPALNTLMLHAGDSVVVPRAGIVYVVGDVARSGGYVMRDDGRLSIAQLVSVGGGLLPTAKASRARLVRTTSGGREEFEVNLKEILRGRAADLQLQPGDILFVPNSAFRSAANRLQNITQMAAGAAIYTSLN
jgi:polysaccharide export outer membrane protein